MSDAVDHPLVALVNTQKRYTNAFSPNKKYPEIKKLGIYKEINPENTVYQSVRELFQLLKLDKENIGTQHWNPLTEIIKPGDKVLIKPNMVKHKSDLHNTDASLTELITHPSIISAVLDYVVLALKNKGTIIIGDAPIQEALFGKILDYLQLNNLKKKYDSISGITIEIIDFRQERAINRKFKEIQRISLLSYPRYRIIFLFQIV
jgi:uncharacterized protein (DUF362 family)